VCGAGLYVRIDALRDFFWYPSDGTVRSSTVGVSDCESGYIIRRFPNRSDMESGRDDALAFIAALIEAIATSGNRVLFADEIVVDE